MKGKFFGQQAIEFILISSIILLGSIMGFLYFGEKLASFFTSDSAIGNTSNHRVNIISAPQNINENNQSTLVETPTLTTENNTVNTTSTEQTMAYAPINNTEYSSSSFPVYTNTSTSEYSTINTPTEHTQNINGVPVTFRADGSASFRINGQLINLNSDTMNNLNTVFQTVGPSGLDTEVMKALQELIIKHEAEYPETAVPVNMVFGKGVRTQGLIDNSDGVGTTYEGSAVLNMISVYVGGDYITIQKDQTSNMDGFCSYCQDNTKILKTTRTVGNEFSGKFDQNYVNCQASTGKYPDQCRYSPYGYSNTNSEGSSSWTFDFKEPTYQSLY